MPKSADPLATYNAKRDFAKTAEPKGARAAKPGNSFMVQKHDATRLHWDLRLEVDGVLKSWAVTRGPSLDPDDKRLAVRTEDHPLSYATFEGTIPAGEYGGGTVMLWDRGTWAPAPGKSARDLDKGHLHFELRGERMKGEWLLVRMKPRPKEKRENWLLRKIDDAYAEPAHDIAARALTSIKSGRTMNEIAADKKPPAKAAPSGKPPAFTKPQLATLVDHPPTGSQWLHEVKYDGYRCLLAVGGGRARVFTRTGLDWSAKFPEIAAAGAAFDTPALIDGEIVALGADGKPSFSALQAAMKAGGEGLVMFAFDLLSLGGKDLRRLPNVERKTLLRPLVEGGDAIQFAEHVVGGGEKLFDAMCREGYEGIVSKKADAAYAARRTRAWLKVKCTRRQEFVIVGWTASASKPRAFKSLLLALTGDDGELKYAGKVGTGFGAALLADIGGKLARLERKSPSVDAPKAATRGAHWVAPRLVAEVAFAEFTADGVVRHASFVGLRDDKPARAAKREVKAPTPAPSAASIKISNRSRVIFPESGLTKGDLADYYTAVAAIMLPWAAERPVSLVRCPQGRAKKCFFQKHDSGSFGEDVHHIDIREKDGGKEPYLYVKDADGLLTCVQMGTIEFHGWGSRVEDVEKPDRMVFDLDPDEGLDFEQVKSAARHLRDELAALGLVSFAMLSGGKGLHVVAPLTPEAKWPAVKDFASRFSTALAEVDPNRFTATMSKAKRKGRIFIDWLRNQRGATAILPYAARARPGATVAAPIDWDELRDIETPGRFSIRDADELVERASSAALRGWGVARQVLPDL